MKGTALILFCVVAFCYKGEAFQADNEDKADLEQLMRIIGKSRALDRHKKDNEKNEVRSLSFKYKNCGKSGEPIQVESLTLGPDPLRLPGNITLSVKASTSKDLTAPLKVDLKVEKKVLVWVEVPCIDDVGSCTYDDVCELLPQFTCPPEFKKYGIPCQCPIKAGDYNLPSSTIDVSKLPDLPSFLTDGDYKVTAKLKSGSVELGCINLELSIKKG